VQQLFAGCELVHRNDAVALCLNSTNYFAD